MLIKGNIEKIVYKTPDEQFGVFSISSSDENIGQCTCVGVARGLNESHYVTLEGEFVEHKKFGRQFKFTKCTVSEPEGVAAILNYLSSGAIKGIKTALAARIISRFGEDTLKIMENEPERLVEIKGISERKAMEIVAQMTAQKDVRDALIYLQGLGITNNMALKIYDAYGTAIYRIFSENPYIIAENIRGIGFKTIDKIAVNAGFVADSESRIKAGIHYCLMEAQTDGDTYLPKEVLLGKTLELLGIEEIELEKCLRDMYIDGKIFIREDKVMLSYINTEEIKSALKLKNLMGFFEYERLSEDEESRRLENFHDYTERLKEREGIELDEEQLGAVYTSAHNGVFVLTGGPGTGKTTTISAMIHYFMDNGFSVSLTAPTGRAAKRMEEQTGYVAKTLHRLLEVNGVETTDEMPKFNRNEDNPLEIDVVIVDEMSMVDIHMFYYLLCAMRPGMRLIMCGDINQLPSVGPGNVLKDLINSGCIKYKSLEKIYRQKEGSEIVVNAHLINRGEKPALDNKGNDFFFLERDDKAKVYRDAVTLVRDKLPRQFGCKVFEVQVLCPARKGIYGVETFNTILQANLNPPMPSKPELVFGENIFRLGDKVMQIKNDYNAVWTVKGFNDITVDEGEGVFNGDMGEVTKVNPIEGSLTVTFDDNKEIEYAGQDLANLELSYAITIHKAQGSEYPVIVMPIVEGSPMLFNRNLLYTGVTRASECVLILGRKDMIYHMIETNGDYDRYCDFITKLKEVISD